MEQFLTETTGLSTLTISKYSYEEYVSFEIPERIAEDFIVKSGMQKCLQGRSGKDEKTEDHFLRTSLRTLFCAVLFRFYADRSTDQ